MTRRTAVVGLGASVAAMVLTACTKPETATPTATTNPAAPPPKVTVTLPKASEGGTISSRPDITVASDGTVSAVTVTDPKGAKVDGVLLRDGKAWTPKTQLKYDTKYTVTATADKGGKKGTGTASFTTMSAPDGTNGVDFYIQSGTVGVGLPIVFKFVESIPDNKRVEVLRHLHVRTAQPVEGAWKWIGADEVHFRPKDYWKTGTKIQVVAGIGGVEMGEGQYGKRDRTLNLTVGPKIEMVADGKAHTAIVYKDGAVLKKMPASLGKPSSPSSSGQLVVMETRPNALFDSSTFGVPSDSPGGYKTKVKYVARLTWGGEFIHAAPWSVGDQGERNVSHGCINLSTSNAKWFFDLAHPGDLVKVVNTSQKVKQDDGWTAWTMPWETYSAKATKATTEKLV